MIRYVLAALLWSASVSVAHAENILMARIQSDVERVLEAANEALEEHGYTVAHEQKCDGGLKGFGYKTDLYRVLFFGKPEEVRYLSRRYPQLIPYLPLKIAIIAEGDEVLVASFNPEKYGVFFSQRELITQFARWKSDLDSIMAALRR